LIKGKHVMNPVAIANALNEYFCCIGSQLSDQLLKNSNNNNPTSLSFKEFLGTSVSSSFFCENVSEIEVKLAIQKLKHKKSCGPDGIPTDLYKDNIIVMSKPL